MVKDGTMSQRRSTERRLGMYVPLTPLPLVTSHLTSYQIPSKSGHLSKGVDYGFTPTLSPMLFFTLLLYRSLALNFVL